MTTEDRPIEQVRVPARHGAGIVVRNGQRLKVVAVEGKQIGDLFAFVLNSLDETLSASVTRRYMDRFNLVVGKPIYSNKYRPLLLIEEDTVGRHDILNSACSPEFYKEAYGLDDHRSCRQNLIEAVRESGYDPPYLYSDPINLFQNTPIVDVEGRRDVGESPSKAGDYIAFRAMDDMLAAVSSCPQDMNNANGGNPTDLMLEVYE